MTSLSRPDSPSILADAAAVAAAASPRSAFSSMDVGGRSSAPLPVDSRAVSPLPSIDIRLCPAEREDELELIREEIDDVEFGTFGAGGAVDHGVSHEHKREMMRYYHQIQEYFRHNLEKQYPDSDIEIVGVDLTYNAIHFERDGVEQSIEIEGDEIPQLHILKDLIVRYSNIQRWEIPEYNKGDIAPSYAKEALLDRSYRIDKHLNAPRFDRVGDFIREFGEDIFEGLPDTAVYKLRRQIQMRDTIHQGLGVQLQMRIHAFEAELQRPVDPAHARQIRKTITKLKAFRDRLDGSSRVVTYLGIAYRARAKALIEQKDREERQNAGPAGVDEQGLENQKREIAVQVREQLREKISEYLSSKSGSPKDDPSMIPNVEKSIATHIAQSMPDSVLESPVGYPFRDDKLTDEEKRFAVDAASMVRVPSDRKRKEHAEHYRKSEMEIRSKSLEEAIFVDYLDAVERRAEYLCAVRAAGDLEGPELLELNDPAMGRIFDRMLAGTTTLDGDDVPTDQHMKDYFLKDLFSDMVQRFAQMNDRFDDLATQQQDPREIHLNAGIFRGAQGPARQQRVVERAKQPGSNFRRFEMNWGMTSGAREHREQGYRHLKAAMRGIIPGHRQERDIPLMYDMRPPAQAQ